MSTSAVCAPVAPGLQRGECVVLLAGADESREGGALLVLAAATTTAAAVAFVVRYSSGLLQVTVTDEDCVRLQLPPMVPWPAASSGFTVSVDHAVECTTGISASDRARTISALAAPDSTPATFVRPGHVLPYRIPTPGRLCRGNIGSGGGEDAALAAASLIGACGLGPHAAFAHLVTDESAPHLATIEDGYRFAAEHRLDVVTTATAPRELIGSVS